MAAQPLLLLLSSAVSLLLFTCQAQEAYDQLPDNFRKGVDLALAKVNSHVGIQHHFLYFKDGARSDIQPGFDVTYIYHHFFLKATTCQKGTVDSSACRFRNDRPLVDCAICYKTLRGEIEEEPKPYVHCIHKPALTEDMKRARVEHCNRMGYSSGAPTLLASVGNDA